MPETETVVVDAEVVDEHAAEHQEHPPPAAPSTAIARRERRSEVIRPLDAEAVVESFAAYQALLPRLLNDSDYQAAEGGKKFVKKSGWRKIATAFDLDVIRVTDGVERDDQGHPVRAWATYRAIAPSGRTMDGDGYCSADEPRFNRAAGRQKLENDLRSTATTRAKNRAISDLVGMGDVSAEEIDAGAAGGAGAAPPPWTLEATDERKQQLVTSLTVLLGSEERAIAVCKGAKQSIGVVPDVLVAFARGMVAVKTADEQAGKPAAETPPAQTTMSGDDLGPPADAPPAADATAEEPPYAVGAAAWRDAPAQAQKWCPNGQAAVDGATCDNPDCPVHGIPF